MSSQFSLLIELNILIAARNIFDFLSNPKASALSTNCLMLSGLSKKNLGKLNTYETICDEQIPQFLKNSILGIIVFCKSDLRNQAEVLNNLTTSSFDPKTVFKSEIEGAILSSTLLVKIQGSLATISATSWVENPKSWKILNLGLMV